MNETEKVLRSLLARARKERNKAEAQVRSLRNKLKDAQGRVEHARAQRNDLAGLLRAQEHMLLKVAADTFMACRLNPKHDPDVKAIVKAAQTKYGGAP